MPDHLLEQLITIPLFTGIIGYITNWSGVLMLFAPINFHGIDPARARKAMQDHLADVLRTIEPLAG